MSINLLKRLESSVYSFKVTLEKILNLITSTINIIDEYSKYGKGDIDVTDLNISNDFDADDQNTDYFAVGKKVRISLEDMDYISWKMNWKEIVRF